MLLPLLVVPMTNECLVSGWGVNGTYAVGRASKATMLGSVGGLWFQTPQAPGLPLVYKTVTPPGGGQYVRIGPLS